MHYHNLNNTEPHQHSSIYELQKFCDRAVKTYVDIDAYPPRRGGRRGWGGRGRGRGRGGYGGNRDKIIMIIYHHIVEEVVVDMEVVVIVEVVVVEEEDVVGMTNVKVQHHYLHKSHN